MKKFTLLSLLIAFSVFAKAQITLNHTDYNYSANGDTFEFVSIVNSSVVLPQSGADMIWDYMGLQTDGDFSVIYEGVSDPDFPNSTMRTPTTTNYLGVVVPTYRYHSYDTTGFRQNGIFQPSVALPLAGVTGNIADTLFVVGGPNIETEPWYFFRLPMVYGNSSDITGEGAINFIANIPTFNLSNFPIKQTLERNRKLTIEGWGKLVVMNPNSEIDTFEVLLQKEVMTRTTFYYDGNNNLLPPTLLNPLQLTQGESSTTTYYSFHTKGLNQFALNLTERDGAITTASYNKQLFTNGMPVSTEVILVNKTVHSVYPNPIQGNQFQLEIEKNNSENWQLDIYNVLGQSVQNELVIDNNSTVQLKSNLPNGQYFYTIRNENGQTVANGKLVR